ncbi:MAG: methyltransferase domain-containing protein [Clostridiales Family XIII bacterium]|nr:methyltransferase domain-containing protein [Clostridiales Family XIII bacterium]
MAPGAESGAAAAGSDCPHVGICGGCAYRGVPYDEQLEIKNAQVLEYLHDNKVVPLAYDGIAPAPRSSAYRNRMDYSFGDEVKDGEMTLGLHKRGSYMSVIDTDGCLIVPDDFNTIREAVLAWARASGHGFWHKRTHSGFLRSLVLRRGERTRELLVNLVTTDEETLDAENFMDMVRGLPLTDSISGIVHTIYNGRADTVACDSMSTLFGRDHFFEELLGLRFRVNALSFFQTNTSAVEAMFAEALTMLPDLNGKAVFDLYCGTGTISLAVASRAASVTGVEIVPESVRAAEENAALNNTANCRFICGDALEALERIDGGAAPERANGIDGGETRRENREPHERGAVFPAKPDVLVVDPPRMGMHPKALRKILSYGLPEILYISCNPKTFARDMAAMQFVGYRLDRLKAYDNFPYTKHTELAARIVRS